MERLRPYRAAFGTRFTVMLQYRGAALAGFSTQCWWGGIKVMILTAFYQAGSAEQLAPISLASSITYTWVGQALFALLPWLADPEVALGVRTGSVAYDRLRPVDAYALWYARAAGWLVSRTLPRALLLGAFAALALPVLGFEQWAWRAPANAAAAAAFAVSLALAVLLSSAVLMLLNVAVVAARDARGVNVLMAPLVMVFSGNLLPLPLLPESLSTVLLVQPLAGLLDIPLRLYFGQMNGPQIWAGLGLQVFWTLSLILLGRALLGASLRQLEIQGG